MLDEAGFGWLRLVDNGVVRAAAEQMPGLPVVRAYHLIPAGASKARAVARHMQARGYAPEECIAVGDSREDMDAADVVGAFWLVANALERDPTLEAEVRAAGRGADRLRVLRRRRLRGGGHDPGRAPGRLGQGPCRLEAAVAARTTSALAGCRSSRCPRRRACGSSGQRRQRVDGVASSS